MHTYIHTYRMVGRCEVVGNKLRYEIKRVLAVVAGMELPIPWIAKGTLGRLNLDFFDGGMWIERAGGGLNVYRYAGVCWLVVCACVYVCVCDLFRGSQRALWGDSIWIFLTVICG